MQTSSAQQLKHLAGIEINTYKLHKIETDIANMKAGISEITTKGIKIRSFFNNLLLFCNIFCHYKNISTCR